MAESTISRASLPDIERLPDTVLTDLARLGIEVAKHFGRPQDIEWAYAEGGCGCCRRVR